MIDWIDRILLNYKFPSNVQVCLVLDSCSVHKKPDIKKKLEEKDIKLFIIPGGVTSLLQPLDVCINKPFKDYMREEFNYWFEKEGHLPEREGKSGNLRPPHYHQILEWGLNSFNKINEDLIRKSFKVMIFFRLIFF